MKLLCRFGIHKWVWKVTARPGTIVRRCRRCNKVVVKHSRKSKQLP